MRLASLLGPELKDALTDDPDAVRSALGEFHPEDVAEILDDLPAEDAVELVKVFPPQLGADVIERLSADRQVLVLQAMEPAAAVELLSEMDPDDRADVVQELPEEDARQLLEQLAQREPEAAEEVRELVVWEPETAGGLMTTELVAMPPDAKVWEAIEEVRKAAQADAAETIYCVYVCYGDKLIGTVSLRELILSDPGQELSDVMTDKVVKVAPTDDQEKVAHLMARYDLAVLPVVDEHGDLLGVVTVDDVVDVVIDEATEDAQLQGGVVPLEDSYFSTGMVEFAWKRGTWLIVLFLGQLLTATVMEQNAETLRAVVELALFIPLIISSGGNAGSQSSTLIIRAMAVGELVPRDWWRVFGKELTIGLLLGVVLGGMGFARALVAGENVPPLKLALTVGSSILAVVTLSTIVGSLLPMLIRRLGLDPAVSSTPFIASVVDVLGLLVYFSVAHVVMSGLL